MRAPADNRASELEARILALPDLPYPELRAGWRRLYRVDPPKKIGRELLELGIAWKLQEKALGGHTPATKRRLAELAGTMAENGDLARGRVVSLRPGARLMREWGGETHDVLVTADGFVWKGESWRSLSVIARKITGAQWSGPRFFGLKGKGQPSAPERQSAEAADA